MTRAPRYIVLEKKVGQTPLECVLVWKEKNPQWKDIPASYAGRLDPMAEGKLLVLLGEECKKQKKYTGLDKEYVVEVVLDLGTDTGDVLGLAAYSNVNTKTDRDILKKALRTQEGAHTIPYPIFSSKTVHGKPLFLYALEGKLTEIDIPTHEENIYKITLLDDWKVDAKDLRNQIMETLTKTPRTNEPSKKLGADFRIDAITNQWTETFDAMSARPFHILRLRVICGSGSYMRTLAGRIAGSFGTKGIALSINRTEIGSYISLPFRQGLWAKTYN